MSNLNLPEKAVSLLEAYCNNNVDDAASFRIGLDDALYEYPIIRFLTKASIEETPPGIVRNVHFVLGHTGFFLFNFINSWFVILIFGFVLERHFKNRLVKYALLACLWQMTSCIFSITRYSINDEYGKYAHWSNITGIIAYIFFNVVVCHIFITNHDQKETYVRNGILIWTALGLATFVVGDLLFWEKYDFKFIRLYFATSTVFQLVSYTKAFVAYRRKEIIFPKPFPFTEENVGRLLKVCIFSTANALFFAATGYPVLQYPATGMTFSVMLLAVSMFGEMDFMKRENPETTPLMPP